MKPRFLKAQSEAAVRNYDNGIGWPSLADSVSHFTSIAADKRQPDDRVVVGIDECAKHPQIIAAAELLEIDGWSSGTYPLWAQLRETAEGEPFYLVSSKKFVPWSQLQPSGPLVRARGTPDLVIARTLVTLFLHSDRVVLLSGNRAHDLRGLRYLLQSEVGPALENHHRERFSLLALFKRGSDDDSTFAQRIWPTVLQAHSFRPGFTELLI